MNGFDLFKAVNNADSKYLEQAESFTKIKTHCHAKAFRLSVGIAAAAALMTVTAGATILTRFANKDGVEKYLLEDSADILEEQGLALNYTAENEHVRLTVDAMLFDGNLGEMIMTFQGLDEKGYQSAMVWQDLYLYLADAETGEYIANPYMNGEPIIFGSVGHNSDATTKYTNTSVANMELWNIEKGKTYKLRFGLADQTLPDNERYERNEYGVLKNNVMESIEIETDFTPNVETKTLTNKDGGKVVLSQIGYFTEDKRLTDLSSFKDEREPKLLKKDSPFREDFILGFRSIEGEDMGVDIPKYSAFFNNIIDVNKYDGIEINGIKYTEE